MLVLPHKFREWVGRYYPAEIVGTLGALAGAFAVHHLTGSLVASALAGSVAETVGFYGYFAWRDGAQYYVKHHAHTRRRRATLTAYHTVRDIMIEFGPAELLDSAFVRPFCMYAGPLVASNFAVGLIAGKIVADVVFYGAAATGYELKKRLSRTAVDPIPTADVPENEA